MQEDPRVQVSVCILRRWEILCNGSSMTYVRLWDGISVVSKISALSEVLKRGWRTEGVGARKSLPRHNFRPFFCPLLPMPPYEKENTIPGTFSVVFWVLLVANPLPRTPFRNLWPSPCWGIFCKGWLFPLMQECLGLVYIHIGGPGFLTRALQWRHAKGMSCVLVVCARESSLKCWKLVRCLFCHKRMHAHQDALRGH